MIYRLPKELPPTGDYLRDSITQDPKWIRPDGNHWAHLRSAWLRLVFRTAGGQGRNTTAAKWRDAFRVAVLTACPVDERANALAAIAGDFRRLEQAKDAAAAVAIAFRRDSPLAGLALRLAAHGKIQTWGDGCDALEIIGTNPATDAVAGG